MIKKLALLTLTLSAASAYGSSRVPHGVPSHEAIESAIAKLAEIDGHVAALLGVTGGASTGNVDDRGTLENDGVARNILIGLSKKTERVLDKLDQFDAAVVAGQYVQALPLQNEVCSGLDAIRYDNKNARIAADLPNRGQLTSSLPDFAEIDLVLDDTQSTLICP